MKYCPQCKEQFSDELAFCDVDGTALVDDINSLRAALREPSDSPVPARRMSAPPTGVIALLGILIGIVLCMVVYIAFLTPGLNPNDLPNENRENTSTRAAAPAPLNQIASVPLPSPSATAEESPSPEEAEASPEASPAAAPETANRTAVNQGPISTGERRISEGRTLITMKDGSSVEADAAWEDAQGVWYRRSGLVSFVERSKVEKMSDLSDRPAQATAEAARP